MTLPLKERRKLSDLGRTLTGDAWLTRTLKAGSDAIAALESATDDFEGAGLFQKEKVRFAEICRIAYKVPLLGKTGAPHFARTMSAAREHLGLPALIFDSDAFNLMLRMHDNVRTACALLHIHSAEDAREAACVLDTVIHISYSDNRKYKRPRISEVDVILLCCEYTCVLKATRELCSSSASDDETAAALLQIVPGSLSGVKSTRNCLIPATVRSPDFATGYDDARARNCLQRYLALQGPMTKFQATASLQFPSDIATNCYCATCHELLPPSKSRDPRGKFCGKRGRCHTLSKNKRSRH